MAIRPDTIESHRENVLEVIRTMRRDPCTTLDLSSMARIASMSRHHFLRVFEGVTQVSPGRFLAALRMEGAKRMLMETSLPVTSVCYEIGYSSLGTFTRQFS